ncbi:MAG: type IV toxin-antitoxin system AbiEi family antitoxin domain-containing protein [Ignavibacteriaceae bacterium]
MASSHKKILVFLETHPVFTIRELKKYFSFSEESREASDILMHNKRMGRIGVVKTGLYYALRPGSTEETTQIDPFLLAAKLCDDAVLAFHTALDILGFGHSVFNSYYYYSHRFHPAMRFRKDHFRCVIIPEKIQRKSLNLFGTEKLERSGVKVMVTGKERTLVDVLERPQFCGGFEEMYRSLEKMPYVKTELVLEYLNVREQKNLFAHVGFFLEQHRQQFHIEESFLQTLERYKPAQPLYWDRSRKGGVFKSRWNLIVPEAVDQRKWEEF